MTKKELIKGLKNVPDDYKIMTWDAANQEWKDITVIVYPENGEVTIIAGSMNLPV